jgi:hypothetical protein
VETDLKQGEQTERDLDKTEYEAVPRGFEFQKFPPIQFGPVLHMRFIFKFADEG